MQEPPADPQLRFARHFGLLAVFAGGIAATRYAGFAPRIALAFAGFGALHAVALGLCLRPIPGRRRVVGFVVAAALLSATVASLGLRWGPRALLVIPACAFAGAVGYGILLRCVLRYRLRPAALATTALACSIAAAATSQAIRGHAAAGIFWLAVCWWLAFSLSLYVTDRRPARA
jgi:hypothetical protein